MWLRAPKLFPQLDDTVPAASGELGLFVGMPRCADARIVVGLPSRHYPMRLPVPDEQFAVRVAGDQETEISAFIIEC